MWALVAEITAVVVTTVVEVVWRGTIVVAPAVVVVHAAAAAAVCGAHTPLAAGSSAQVAWNKYAH